ncbi:MAG: septal ring lytic transglycosylase RlpA family protein [Acidobacteria bacterium]|nr:septal ring lytic transglycosylase RlpA family protein [Acidobacteriota bacterium]
MERHHTSDAVLAAGERRPYRNPRISALAGLLASAALVSAACSGNHHPVSPAPAAGSLARGTASWYGPKFNGRRTASGERYDMRKLTAAHPSLPFGSLVQVTNLDNGKQVVVRVNDRGPFGRRRVIDLSYAAARELDMVGPGTARVELALVGRYDPLAPLAPMTMPPAQQPMLLAASPAPAAAPRDGRDPAAAAGSGIEDAGSRDAPAAKVVDAPAPQTPQIVDAQARDAQARDAAGREVDAGDAAPAASADIDRAAATAATARTDSLPPAPAAPASPRNARTPVAAAFHYTVQVGAFGDVERAEALQQDLARHYPAAAVHSDGTWNRVQVGLFADREQAEQLRSELASAGIAAVVVAAH